MTKYLRVFFGDPKPIMTRVVGTVRRRWGLDHPLPDLNG